ncbi:serine-rich adhesin for platelets [Lucilia cuprina]|uniref:serine-rich adhesin for platelets n=1 Tax=Lucilia cuprina TaxID=7375 RepID=UPI001F05ED2C|nr:serine-rich adhesin for platelets [Lucilia cuprina]XP_046811282.1 serine-rich adhesin for platelets [Lucilia cuprina]XP_046811283.1 serine-rich adhesin for platelets [Lucilia cuprina]
MSGGLMSCVRENSPPLDMDVNVSGPLSLPEPNINNSDLMGSVHSSSHHNIMTSTPLAAQPSSSLHAESVGGGAGAGFTPTATPPNTEQTKRRRFHPLRNLRRIFRRRTITTATAAAGDNTPTSTLTGTTASSNSEKNLRSATLSSITSVASASSPSSPLTHQQLQDAYLTQSLPKSKSAYSSLLGGGKKHQSHDYNLNAETKTKSKHKHKNQQKHQQQSKELDYQYQQQPEAEDMFGTTTQTSTSYHHHVHSSSATSSSMATTNAAATKSSLLSQRQSMGVAVFPGAINRSFFTERQKLRSVGDSSQDLDSGSGNDSGTGGGHNSSAAERVKNSGGSASGGEMSDSQRSLSEGRLVDSDYSRDGLSQSHDSVFSESATASSLSIVLKAELADVLRKRRNRPDASDEDLGLPRSPASPQRRAVNSQQHANTGASASASNKSIMGEKHSEVSSLSLLSMNSNEGDDLMLNSTTITNNSSTTTTTEVVQERSTANRYSRSSTMSSISMSSDILRHRDSSFNDTKDEVDLFSSDWQRLSHSAAKHKMAIRPTKKKGGPSRQHRRTLETSIPEANEDLNKFVNKQILDVKDLDTKAKTRSLPPGVNAAKLMDETTTPHTASKESSITKTTKINNSSSTQSTNSSNISTTTTSTTNIFGLRNLTAKASAMFESKDSQQTEEIIKKSEVSKKTEIVDKTSQPMETTETGFLRRLMHRNSKRSIAKANAEEGDQDELDKKQNEPKKIQMSVMNNTVTSSNLVEKTTSEFVTYESTVEEKRKEIKREIYQEGKIMGLTSVTNNFALTAKDERRVEDKSPSKPKSGPAARQRYLPQNISNEDLVKISEEKSVSKESILSKSLTNETFQSTSLIREITKQQSSMNTSPTKNDHHFEKKPKIVGLSAFQQKVSRSNDSFARSSSNTSMVSLDKSDDELTSNKRLQTYEQKQRKSVEKSRSFRAYGEQKEDISSTTVHNNMPSLPDLSLNLRVPYYKDFIVNDKEYSSPSPPELLDEKHTSLGFEINDNKLVKPERENRKSFSNYDKNIIMTTSSTCLGASKTTPTKLLTPAAVVAPFNNSSTNSCNKNISEIENNIDLIVKSPFVSVIRKSINLTEEQADEVTKVTVPATFAAEKVRPSVLSLKKEKSLSEENMLSSPSTASVILRDKPAVKTNTQYTSSMETQTREIERKSAPAVNNKTTNGFRCNSTRRSSSVMESSEIKQRSTVPEFMKIQLNRVDPTRTSKSHVVLAKNVKETSVVVSRASSPEKNINSSSMDDLSFRRLSSESVDINERSSPETEKRFSGLYHEAINKQAKLCIGLPPKSPIKKTPTTPTTPPTPTINERDASREHFKMPAETLENNNNNNNNTAGSNTNSLSLQERRRLFMNEERNKMERKMEEIRFERKKSLSEEVSKKSSTLKCDGEQKEVINKDLSPVDSSVILRKKSFASSVHSLNGNSVNGGSNGSSSSSSSSSNSSNKDDATPELMKVFARRSLKIKDEDLDKMLNTNNANSNVSAPQTLKKFNSPCSNPSVDSDKENQSASDEKLDKLPKLEAKTHTGQSTLNGTVGNTNNNNNRNSLADFRLGGCKLAHSALSMNNNSSNNNNSAASNGDSTTLANNKSFLPPIKIAGGFRAMSIERNNNHNNVLSPTKAATTLERSTIKLGDLSSSSSTDGPLNINKTIERSATMGEFKGIHQRRAEWEQRAKEALK